MQHGVVRGVAHHVLAPVDDPFDPHSRVDRAGVDRAGVDYSRVPPLAQELKAIDVANYLAELMADANKTAWFIKASLRCG